jgi:hypothetical protein
MVFCTAAPACVYCSTEYFMKYTKERRPYYEHIPTNNAGACDYKYGGIRLLFATPGLKAPPTVTLSVMH